MKCVLGALVLLTLCGAGTAGNCYTYPSRMVQTYAATTYYPTTYYQPAAQFQFGYGTDQTENVAKLIDLLKSQVEYGQRRDVERDAEKDRLYKALLEKGIQPQALREAVLPPHPGLQRARQDCARCHSAEDKALKGKGHVFFKGGLWVGSAEDLADARDAVLAGSMPKDRKWSSDDKLSFLDWMTRIPPDQLAASPKAEAPAKGELPR